MDETDFHKPIRGHKSKAQKPTQYVSPDGKSRAPATEREINEAFAIAFRGAVGDKVRQYLKSISINRVLPPGTDPHTITYYEGARWLMGVIDTRIQHGEEKKP